MGSGPQFIAVPDDPVVMPSSGAPITIAEIRTLMTATPLGDGATRARYADMLAKASGLYDQSVDTVGAMPDKELCARLAALLAPGLGISAVDCASRLAGVLGAGGGAPQGSGV